MKLLTTLTYSGIYFDDEELEKAKNMNFSSTTYSIENFSSMLNLIFKFYPKVEKYYAVKEGRIRGIFFSEREYLSLIANYSSADCKSFKSLHKAISFMNPEFYEDNKSAIAFTDGSYCVEKDKYGYGVVFCVNDKTFEFSGSGREPENIQLRNVSGEIEGAKRAIEEAIKRDIQNLVIYYDFEGIEKWATGDWKIKEKHTTVSEYYSFVQDSMSKINITFEKIKAHSGVVFNNRADKLAKIAANSKKCKTTAVAV